MISGFEVGISMLMFLMCTAEGFGLKIVWFGLVGRAAGAAGS
jgi:hypothetical protein